MWKRSLAVAALCAAAAGATPRPGLGPAATARLLRRLRFGGDPGAMARLRLRAQESWTVPGRALPADQQTDEVVFYRSVPLELEQTHNQRALPAAAQQRQQRQAARLRARIDRAQAAAPAEGAGRWLNLGGEIWPLARFEALFSWTAEAMPAGLELRFVPAPGGRPRSRLERLLRRTAGTLRVDPASGQILGGEFHNVGAVDYVGGLLARFTEFSGHFSMQPAGPAWVLRRVVVEVRGRELFRRVRGTETMDYRLEPGSR
ncbi:MAG TPA: hypothetical protein VMV31_13390 [Terriglobales bacterium]|nr:hypothetical protein [Terriglobales bacterium]